MAGVLFAASTDVVHDLPYGEIKNETRNAQVLVLRRDL
jgi:hypothetical protein